jgi:hypothetical protein
MRESNHKKKQPGNEPNPLTAEVSLVVFKSLMEILNSFTSAHPDVEVRVPLDGVIIGLYSAVIGPGSTDRTCDMTGYIVEMLTAFHASMHEAGAEEKPCRAKAHDN